MSKRPRCVIALTIAGSDSGGGAGIQADLKTFAALGVHGTSAITCVTAQNPKGVTAIQPVRPSIVQAQIEAVFTELAPAAVKTGMLYSAAIVRAVAATCRAHRQPPLIVDPVMVATSGARLLQPAAIAVLQKELLPLAALLTPNLDEAAILTGHTLRSVQDMRHAAKALHDRFGCAALVKGGHLPGLKEAVDVFFDGKDELLLSAPFLKGISTHGTGCTYAAAITAYAALGQPLSKAVISAKDFITNAIRHSRRVGRHTVLEPFW